jgi:hypothetical protein
MMSDTFLELAKVGAFMTVATIIVSLLSSETINWHKKFIKVCYFFTIGCCLASFISSK